MERRDLHLHPRVSTGSRGRALVFALAAAVPLVAGQVGRELLPPDDLREAEVAREMWAGGDYVVPRLAGLPFVEKPPGFQAIVASAYAASGGPSATAARLVSLGFALATLVAVFWLGKSSLGVEGAGLAVALLGLSSRFCRTAHTVLLDNALTAALAFAVLFLWLGLGAAEPRARERAYAAAGLALGISFLFKGFVGPGLFGAGLVLYLAATRRFAALRPGLRPLPIVALLIPVLAWGVPFLVRAPELQRIFFIENHWGRASRGFLSNVRPLYFYGLDLFQGFLPAAILLPFAGIVALRRRRIPGGEAGLYFLSFSLGPLALLSFSKAKDSVYALPAYPALALWLAAFCQEELDQSRPAARVAAVAANLALAGAAAGAIVATARLGGLSLRVGAASALLAALSILAARYLRRGALRPAWATSACLASLGWTLWFTGPLAASEVARRSIRTPVEAALTIAGDRTVLLYGASDGFRGAASFWRNRTAEEVPQARVFIERLLQDERAVGLLHRTATDPIPQELRRAAAALGAEPVVEASVPTSDHGAVVVVRARPMEKATGSAPP